MIADGSTPFGTAGSPPVRLATESALATASIVSATASRSGRSDPLRSSGRIACCSAIAVSRPSGMTASAAF